MSPRMLLFTDALGCRRMVFSMPAPRHDDRRIRLHRTKIFHHETVHPRFGPNGAAYAGRLDGGDTDWLGPRPLDNEFSNNLLRPVRRTR